MRSWKHNVNLTRLHNIFKGCCCLCEVLEMLYSFCWEGPLYQYVCWLNRVIYGICHKPLLAFIQASKQFSKHNYVWANFCPVLDLVYRFTEERLFFTKLSSIRNDDKSSFFGSAVLYVDAKWYIWREFSRKFFPDHKVAKINWPFNYKSDDCKSATVCSQMPREHRLPFM